MAEAEAEAVAAGLGLLCNGGVLYVRECYVTCQEIKAMMKWDAAFPDAHSSRHQKQ